MHRGKTTKSASPKNTWKHQNTHVIAFSESLFGKKKKENSKYPNEPRDGTWKEEKDRAVARRPSYIKVLRTASSITTS